MLATLLEQDLREDELRDVAPRGLFDHLHVPPLAHEVADLGERDVAPLVHAVEAAVVVFLDEDLVHDEALVVRRR